MAHKNFDLESNNSYTGGSFSTPAGNSVDVAQGTALSNSGGFAIAATAGTTIIGVSKTQNVFASNNQTVAMEKVMYDPARPETRYRIPITSGTSLVFDAALVTSNTINFTVNGTAMTQVVFTTNNDNTLALIATQLTTQFPTLIAAAAASGTRTVAITPKDGVTITLATIVVAAGASQAGGVQTEKVSQVLQNYYYDLTSVQKIDGMTSSSSTGQMKLEEFESQSRGVFSIVNL